MKARWITPLCAAALLVVGCGASPVVSTDRFAAPSECPDPDEGVTWINLERSFSFSPYGADPAVLEGESDGKRARIRLFREEGRERRPWIDESLEAGEVLVVDFTGGTREYVYLHCSGNLWVGITSPSWSTYPTPPPFATVAPPQALFPSWEVEAEQREGKLFLTFQRKGELLVPIWDSLAKVRLASGEVQEFECRMTSELPEVIECSGDDPGESVLIELWLMRLTPAGWLWEQSGFWLVPLVLTTPTPWNPGEIQFTPSLP